MPSLTSSRIKSAAADLGFDLCGIAPAENFPELSFLKEWLARGYAGEMAWMARTAARRADVRHVVPGARSVIVTGTIYNTDRPYSTECADAGAALISRYAWGDDYHDVLGKRLARLLAWMRAESAEPFDARAYVDTGPVQERVYAQYAGVGWIGKNTCLINPELGSWLFLASIVCTLSLEPDRPVFDQCGACTLCIEACPTDALREPHVLDSTRCLSYLTIELRGEIPDEHRAAMGSHVYGCDICQEVCPYNQLPRCSSDSAWRPRAGLDLPALVELWRRPDDELRRLVKGSAMTRPKITGLRRNLAVAIGNSRSAAAIAELEQSSTNRPSADDPVVKRHIDWARQRQPGL
ncbi:MAG TPA: tRNA epoxyqueuosine(34) reductase QueG [Vicinamibacterales bacterium]|nr:tRNA epoxyqueuosine(34) reductase QueG [Vicinamibacterales bacterium]